MKASGRCPKCDSSKIGYLERVIDQVGGDNRVGAFVGRTKNEGWLAGDHYMGELEAYICAECGFFETYVRNPESLPFEKFKGFRWVDQEAGV